MSFRRIYVTVVEIPSYTVPFYETRRKAYLVHTYTPNMTAAVPTARAQPSRGARENSYFFGACLDYKTAIYYVPSFLVEIKLLRHLLYTHCITGMPDEHSTSLTAVVCGPVSVPVPVPTTSTSMTLNLLPRCMVNLTASAGSQWGRGYFGSCTAERHRRSVGEDGRQGGGHSGRNVGRRTAVGGYGYYCCPRCYCCCF